MSKTKVVYNYESILIPGLTEKSLSSVIESKYPKVLTNIKLNDDTYFLQKMYFYKESSSIWLILQNNSDPNMNSGKTLYLAALIALNGPQSSGIDEMFKLGPSPKNVELTLNNDFKDGGKAQINDSNGTITVVLRDPVNIKTTEVPQGLTFYTKTITDLNLDTSKPDAIVIKSFMDWAMSCELEGEGPEDKTEATKKPTDGLMNNINMIMTMVLVVGALNLASPQIYKLFIVPILRTYGSDPKAGEKPVTSIHLLWVITLSMMILQLIIFGFSGKGSPFYFLALMLILILVSIEKSLSENFVDGGKKSLLVADEINIGGGEVLKNNIGGYISIFTTDKSWAVFGLKMFFVMSMLTLWSSNFNILADTSIENNRAFQMFMVTFPNYLLYAITITVWSYMDYNNTYWMVAKIVLLIASVGWFAGSMVALFKK
jgi:hypothetical protein